MALEAVMMKPYVIDAIESLKQTSEYYIQHQMKNCYIDTLENIEKAEYIRDNCFRECDSKIPVIDFYKLSPEGEQEVADKKRAEEEAERLRQEEQLRIQHAAYIATRTQSRALLEKRYMNAFQCGVVPRVMKDSDIIKATKHISDEDDVRIQNRIRELFPVFYTQ